MKLNRVIVVFKRRIATRLDMAGSGTALRDREAKHDKTIFRVRRALEAEKIPYKFIERENLKTTLSADLIIAVGGDGTFLAASHFAGDVPLLGVNSMPGHSVGFFCSAHAENIETKLKQISGDKTKLARLPLIESFINSRPVPALALNEILFAGTTPADMVRYRLIAGKKKETQKSSGVWISAGPGSTAAIRSAGGKRLPVRSKRLQFVVRELCLAPVSKYQMARGILTPGKSVSIIPEMTGAKIFIDGSKIAYPVPFGSRFEATIAKCKLRVFL